MAYRELGVIEIREVWRRFCLGEGLRAIARGTGNDRKTVAKYVAAAVAAGLSPRGARGRRTPTWRPCSGRRPRPGAAARALPERLTPHREQIATWLGEGLRLTKIHRRLRAHGVTVPYSSLHRFARAHLGFGAPTMTVRVAEPPPGEAAEVDFGLLGLWFDPAIVSGAVASTACSSPSPSAAMRFWPSPCARISRPVLDGLESGLGLLRWRGAPTRRGQSQAGHHPRRSLHARDRPRVSRVRAVSRLPRRPGPRRGTPPGNRKSSAGIPYVRQDFFRGETFRDLADLQARAVRWCRDLAGTRVHGTTRQVPRVVFETVEQPTLLPLAPEPFDRPTWAKSTVHPDHHIQFRHALYSVPTRYLGARGRRPRRFSPRPDLSPWGTDQGPSAAAAGRAGHRLH